jgi:hypothetical protein
MSNHCDEMARCLCSSYRQYLELRGKYDFNNISENVSRAEARVRDRTSVGFLILFTVGLVWWMFSMEYFPVKWAEMRILEFGRVTDRTTASYSTILLIDKSTSGKSCRVRLNGLYPANFLERQFPLNDNFAIYTRGIAREENCHMQLLNPITHWPEFIWTCFACVMLFIGGCELWLIADELLLKYWVRRHLQQRQALIDRCKPSILS